MDNTRVSEPSFDQREPAWDIAYLFPPQGAWSAEEYLALDTNRLVEYDHGRIEVLPMASRVHQLLVAYLFEVIKAFLQLHHPGFFILFAPHPVRLDSEKYREPDIMVLLPEHAHRSREQYCEQPDLVMEIVSPDYRKHDFQTKRREYAQAGIPEYWIVDPQEEQITVLTLQERSYAVYGVFERDQKADSVLLKGFEVSVSKVFDASR